MRLRRLIVPLLLVLAALPAQAQETRGTINGIVQDQGGVIPGAVVTVRNTETGQLGTGSGFDNRNTGNNYTIDGAQNNGFGRRIASSPNSDQIEEVRIETSTFDASQGHGPGLSVSMMTRGGTNTLRGSANYTHRQNRLNSPTLQQKVTFKRDPRVEKAWRAGREHIAAFTLGGPLVIPKIIDGRGKAFFFGNFSMSNNSAPGFDSGPILGPSLRTSPGDVLSAARSAVSKPAAAISQCRRRIIHNRAALVNNAG